MSLLLNLKDPFRGVQSISEGEEEVAYHHWWTEQVNEADCGSRHSWAARIAAVQGKHKGAHSAKISDVESSVSGSARTAYFSDMPSLYEGRIPPNCFEIPTIKHSYLPPKKTKFFNFILRVFFQ